MTIFFTEVKMALQDASETASGFLLQYPTKSSRGRLGTWSTSFLDHEEGWIPHDALEDRFGAGGIPEETRGLEWNGTLGARGLDLSARLLLFRPNESSTLGLTLGFGTFVHRLLYPDPSQPAEAEVGRAVLELAHAAATTFGASGYVFATNDDDLQVVPPADELQLHMLSPQDPIDIEGTGPPFESWRFMALSESIVDYSAVRGAWGGSDRVARTIGGYVLVNLLTGEGGG